MIRQYGVIPYRSGADGGVEILLITSRETRRWIVPRGNAIAGLAPPRSAAREAYEEAGIDGPVGTEVIGLYRYDKRRPDGSIDEAEVLLFEMRVVRMLDAWPEQGERERRWFAWRDAAAAVTEADLAALIEAFARSREA
ncbi:MAG TPA: NUDIX hydrolase [Allosphingosinicella sp.]|nr:NUDIX hydrolase [Allosphingosinicella sp.]